MSFKLYLNLCVELVGFKEFQIFFRECLFFMMIFLVADISVYNVASLTTYRKGAIANLPFEFMREEFILVDKSGA